MNVTENFIKYIKFFAKLNDMKLGTLEEQLQVSKGYFSRYAKRGWKKISGDMIQKAADVLNVSCEKLFADYTEETAARELIKNKRCRSLGINVKNDKYQCYVECDDMRIELTEHCSISEAVEEYQSLIEIIRKKGMKE